MKKIISLLLAMIMVFSLATVAFADQTAAPSDEATVTLTKVYKEVNGTETSKNPAETFVVTIVADGVTNAGVNVTDANMPVPTVNTVSYTLGEATAEGTEKDFTFTLPTIATPAEREAFANATAPTTPTDKYMGVGVYKYKINEVASNKAGVYSYSNDMYLVVTVVEGGDDQLRVATVHVESPFATEAASKVDQFENVYKAGDLNITKTVTGNLGDKDKYFDIQVVLTGDSAKVYEAIAIVGGSEATNATSVNFVKTEATDEAAATMIATVNLKIKHGETITLENIPYEVKYNVTETDLSDYTETITIETNATVDASAENVGIVNDKTAEVDTGIALDSAPYFVILAVAMFGMVALVSKKRYEV